MKRRTFIKSIGAAFAVPLMPVPSLALGSVAPVISADNYRWAETIARAHNSCNIAMLQRHLNLDVSTATALKSQLVKNGVISAYANEFGIHKAMKPLFEGAFPKSHVPADAARATLHEDVGRLGAEDHAFEGDCVHGVDGADCAYCGMYDVERHLASVVRGIEQRGMFS